LPSFTESFSAPGLSERLTSKRGKHLHGGDSTQGLKNSNVSKKTLNQTIRIRLGSNLARFIDNSATEENSKTKLAK
jgi:hypothetical protein